MNVNWEKLIEFFKLKTGLCYYNSNKTELITRCYNCEKDSNKSHGHLYIKVNEDELFYNCFKCNSSGTLTKLIKQYGDEPINYLSEDIINRKVIKNVNKNFNLKNINRIIRECDLSKNKLKINYLKGRIGHKIDIDDVPNLVLDLEYFIKDNNIRISENQEKMLPFLYSNFIGFLTIRGTQLVCRNIDETSSFRYYKLDLIGEETIYKDFYGVETGSIKEETNTVVLCEGPFDLLVPYYSNLFDDIKNNSCIWAAVLNKKIDTMIQSVLDHCCLSKAKFVIFADNDVKYDDVIMKNVRFHPQVQSVEFLWNTKGKDFGKLPIVPTKSMFSFKFF